MIDDPQNNFTNCFVVTAQSAGGVHIRITTVDLSSYPDEAEYDQVVQDLVDMLSAHPRFSYVDGAKVYEGHATVTPTV